MKDVRRRSGSLPRGLRLLPSLSVTPYCGSGKGGCPLAFVVGERRHLFSFLVSRNSVVFRCFISLHLGSITPEWASHCGRRERSLSWETVSLLGCNWRPCFFSVFLDNLDWNPGRVASASVNHWRCVKWTGQRWKSELSYNVYAAAWKKINRESSNVAIGLAKKSLSLWKYREKRRRRVKQVNGTASSFIQTKDEHVLFR